MFRDSRVLLDGRGIRRAGAVQIVEAGAAVLTGAGAAVFVGAGAGAFAGAGAAAIVLGAGVLFWRHMQRLGPAGG